MFKKLKQSVDQLKNSKDGKVVASNFGYLMVLRITGYIFPLLTIPYLARVIGVDGFGKIAFASGVIVWLITVTDWGFNFTATRDVAACKNNPTEVSEIFSQVLWSRLFLMMVSFALLLIAILLIPVFNQNKQILLISFLLVPGSILFPEWFFQAMERMRYITILSLLSRTIFTILIFIFIKNESDYIYQPLLLSLGQIVCGIFAMYIIIVKWKVKLDPPDLQIIRAKIKNSSDVFINNIMPNLYNSFSVVLLGFFGGSIANGLLDAGSKFVSISQQFLEIISRVFFPLLSRKINSHSLYAKINITLSFLTFITLLILAPLIIRLFYTSAFSEATLVLQIMSSSIIFSALMSTYGTNFMILKGYEKNLRNITSICSLVGFVLSFPLIYFYSFIGAAITITFTRALLGLSIMHRAHRIKKSEATILLQKLNIN